MTSEQQSAAASLSEIARVERRTREAVIYGGASAVLIMWGVLTAASYVFGHFQPHHAGIAWLVMDATGIVGSAFIVLGRAVTPDHRIWAWRLICAQLVLILYGAIWVVLLGPFDGRRLDAFWPILFMLGYVMAGIWVGRFFIICGAIVTALTVAGYLWSGPWFQLWMAAIEGTALISGGLWLRRVGAAP
jgi:Kef-type K+ transport system membrane component KefB